MYITSVFLLLLLLLSCNFEISRAVVTKRKSDESIPATADDNDATDDDQIGPLRDPSQLVARTRPVSGRMALPKRVTVPKQLRLKLNGNQYSDLKRLLMNGVITVDLNRVELGASNLPTSDVLEAMTYAIGHFEFHCAQAILKYHPLILEYDSIWKSVESESILEYVLKRLGSHAPISELEWLALLHASHLDNISIDTSLFSRIEPGSDASFGFLEALLKGPRRRHSLLRFLLRRNLVAHEKHWTILFENMSIKSGLQPFINAEYRFMNPDVLMLGLIAAVKYRNVEAVIMFLKVDTKMTDEVWRYILAMKDPTFIEKVVAVRRVPKHIYLQAEDDNYRYLYLLKRRDCQFPWLGFCMP